MALPLGVVREGFLVGLVVLERLAERELEVQAILVAEIVALQRGAQRGDDRRPRSEKS